MKVSSPAPSRARSLPSPPFTVSAPWLPMSTSSPRPPFSDRVSEPAASALALITSAPASPFDREDIAGLHMRDVDGGRQACDVNHATRGADGHDVAGCRPIHDDAIDLAIAGATG